ncbi:MAG: BTAD domain-containing putative transcriptional regulator [bacterium]
MQTNIPAKLQSPVINYIVFRERLFRVLDKARNKKSIWITGLPGSGKTTLIASYLSAKGLPHAWYHIDRSDIDLATFFYYLKLLVKGINGKKCVRLPALTPEYLQNISIFAKRYFEDLYTMLPKGFALVFDNYHEVNSNPLFHTIMHEALITVPEHGNVILISRTEPPDTFSRLRANSMMEVINNEMIKFTPEETHELIRLRSSENHTPDIIKKLHDWTDGWAAGIVLMLEQHKGSLDAISDRDFKDYQAIFDYFSAEIFDRLTSEMKEFLLKTSLFSSMTVDMANKMTKRDDSERILNELVKSQYFTIKRQDNTYTYHDLFREFLLLKMRSIFDQENQIKIQRNAAMILLNTGYVEDAAVLVLRSKDWTEAIKLILKQASALISQGRNQTLDAWLRELPDEVLKKDPWLIYWFGMCRLPFEPSKAHVLFEKAFKLFTKSADKTGMFLAWTGAVYSVTYQFGNYKLYDRWIKIMEGLMHKNKSFPSQEIAASATYAMLTAMVFRQPFNPRIKRWIEQGFSILEKSKNLDFNIQLSLIISLYYIFIGDFPRAGAVIAPYKGLVYSNKVSPLTFITFKDLEVVYGWETVEYDPDFKPIFEGLKLAESTGIYALNPTLLVYGAGWALASGAISLAKKLLHEASKSIGQVGSFDASWYHFVCSLESMFHKDFTTARMHQQTALRLSFECGSINLIVINYLHTSFLLHALSEDKKALHYLHKAYTLGRWSNHLKYMYFIGMAHINFDQGNRKSGLMFLRKAMKLGRDKGYINFPSFVPSDMAQLCLKALDAGITPEYVRGLIRRRNLFPDTPPYAYENWPWTIKIYTLGSFKILHDDAPIVLSRKAQLKPIELLQFLIINHDKPVELDHISGVLWPDAPGDYAHQTLDTTIHRLRKLLGSNDAVISEAGRLMLNPKMCWVDVAAYEYLLNSTDSLMTGNGRSTAPSGKQEEIRAMERRIFNIYRGDFFSQDSIPSWAIGFRSMLHDKFLHFIEMLGAYYERIGNTAQAILTYKKGLEIDNQAELFYQRLMLLYKLHGRTGEAVVLYKRCEEILSRTLDIKPSDKTKKIYQSIIESKN